MTTPLKLTTADVWRGYAAALEMCARDLDVSIEAIRVTRTDVHYKSAQIYVGLDGPRRVTHVIKTQPGRSPAQDFEGLRHAERAFAARDRLGPHAFGAIAPIGLRAEEPCFLAMRYVSGAPVRPTFDAALLRLRGGAAFGEALERSRGIGAWLAVFRSFEVREAGGHTPESYLRFCSERLAEIEERLGAGSRLRGLQARLESLAASMAPADQDRLRRLYPRHGDLAPQNFLLAAPDRLVGLDFGTFAHAPLNADYFHFRSRLEHYSLRRPWAGRRALALWQAFSETFTGAEGSRTFAFYGYLYALLANLALKAERGSGGGRRSRGGPSSRLKVWLWMRQRLRWLARLTGELERDVELLRSAL